MTDKAQEFASPDGYCTKLNKAGEKCRSRAVKGSMVCYHHGGKLPVVRAAGTLRIARDKAQQEVLKRLREERVGRVDTIREMDRLAAEVITWKDVCRERLDYVLEHEEIRYEGKTGEQMRAEVVLYTQALDRCNAVLSTNVRLNIAEKRVELDKAKAIVMSMAIREILDKLDLSPEQHAKAPAIVQGVMLELSAEVS